MIFPSWRKFSDRKDLVLCNHLESFLLDGDSKLWMQLENLDASIKKKWADTTEDKEFVASPQTFKYIYNLKAHVTEKHPLGWEYVCIVLTFEGEITKMKSGLNNYLVVANQHCVKPMFSTHFSVSIVLRELFTTQVHKDFF